MRLSCIFLHDHFGGNSVVLRTNNGSNGLGLNTTPRYIQRWIIISHTRLNGIIRVKQLCKGKSAPVSMSCVVFDISEIQVSLQTIEVSGSVHVDTAAILFCYVVLNRSTVNIDLNLKIVSVCMSIETYMWVCLLIKFNKLTLKMQSTAVFTRPIVCDVGASAKG